MNIKTPQQEIDEIKADQFGVLTIEERHKNLANLEIHWYENNKIPKDKLDLEIKNVHEHLFVETYIYNMICKSQATDLHTLHEYKNRPDYQEHYTLADIKEIQSNADECTQALNELDVKLDKLTDYFSMLADGNIVSDYTQI